MVAGGFECDLRPIAELDEEELKRVAEDVSRSNPPVRNVVVCGIFSPLDNTTTTNQEEHVAEIIQSKCPGITYTLSHKIGLAGLLERENTAILNEALKPFAETSMKSLSQVLQTMELSCPIFLTRNDGTLLRMEEAVKNPVLSFFSRSTNSLQGAAFLSGLNEAIAVDIGGTITNIGMIQDGFPARVFTQCKIGGVRTSLTVVNTVTQELGGGYTSTLNNNSLILGNSVGRELTSKALCFGGDTCTVTDVAVAAGVAPHSICHVPFLVLESLSPRLVYKTISHIQHSIENGIEHLTRDEVDVPAVLVGGGRCLLDESSSLKGSSSVTFPKQYGEVAGAIGAALAKVGATIDSIEMVKSKAGEEEEREKEEILQRSRDIAISEVEKKGAIPSKVYIYKEEVVCSGKRVRVRIRAIGPLEEVHSGEVKDNPHWPFASEEERTMDQSAGLPDPQTNSEQWFLGEEDLQCVAIGAGIMGCGGGGDPYIGQLQARRKLIEGKTITIVNPCRLKESDIGLVTFVAMMGAPIVILETLSGNDTKLALDALQRVLASGIYDTDKGWEEGGKKGNASLRVTEKDMGGGKNVSIAETNDLCNIDVSNVKMSRKITHLMSGEIGGINTLEPLVLGAELNLPVLDADGMGRSFPELQMYAPFIYGCLPYPTAVADNKGEVIACTCVTNAKDLEDFLRDACVKMGMICGICSGVSTLKDVLSKAVTLSISKAWQLGRAVKRAQKSHSNVLKAIVKQQHGVILIVGKVVNMAHVTEAGFGRLEAVVEGTDDYRGHKVKVLAKNENYIVRYLEDGGEEEDTGAVMAVTPDLICIVHSNTGLPVTNEKMIVGLRVGVLVLPANPRLLTPRALRVVGPAAFGLKNVIYHPPTSLQQIGKL